MLCAVAPSSCAGEPLLHEAVSRMEASDAAAVEAADAADAAVLEALALDDGQHAVVTPHEVRRAACLARISSKELERQWDDVVMRPVHQAGDTLCVCQDLDDRRLVRRT